LSARLLTVIQGLRGMLGVHQSQYCIQQKAFSNFIVHEKSLRYGPWVRQASGFDDHALKVKLTFASFFSQILQSGA
jgi:hypothetical protein